MKNLIYISLIIGVVLGCETEEPVSPTPLEPVDTVLEDTTEVYKLDTPFHLRTDTTELRHLLLGTWVPFEECVDSDYGDDTVYTIDAKHTYTFRQDGLVDIKVTQNDSLICQEQYEIRFRHNRVFELPHFFDGTYDTLWLSGSSIAGIHCNQKLINWSIVFRSDTLLSIGIYHSSSAIKYRKIK